MKRILAPILAVALAVTVITPAFASNGSGSNNQQVQKCGDNGYTVGLKLYRESNGNGGGPIQCSNIGAVWPLYDGNLDYRVSGSDWLEDIWNFDNKARSGKVKLWNGTNHGDYCIRFWAGPKGTGGILKTVTFTWTQGSVAWFEFNLPAGASSFSLTYDAIAGGSNACSFMKPTWW